MTTANDTVIGCACANESCYLALRVTASENGDKRISIAGNEMGLKNPVVILDAKGTDTLRAALHGSSERTTEGR